MVVRRSGIESTPAPDGRERIRPEFTISLKLVGGEKLGTKEGNRKSDDDGGDRGKRPGKKAMMRIEVMARGEDGRKDKKKGGGKRSGMKTGAEQMDDWRELAWIGTETARDIETKDLV